MSIERSSKGLANSMFEELDKLRSGETTAQQARSAAAIANTICTISRLEMDFARFVSASRTDNPESLNALPMGKLISAS